ncbi:MAG: sulfite exporter TauE/SafE family protein [Clostridia bacterium]|nr:sulfite exporter TauE/SafE family protein [Clostridia bacterium]
MNIWIALIAAVAGVMLGIGMGGGTLMLPVLLAFGVQQKTAQTAMLLSFLPAAAAALLVSTRSRLAVWKAVWPALPAALCGAVAGAFLSGVLDSVWLRKGFGGLLCVMGVLAGVRVFRKEQGAQLRKKA